MTDQVVDEHFQEDGPYKPIKFEQKYAKRFGVQYMVSSRSCKRVSDHCKLAKLERKGSDSSLVSAIAFPANPRFVMSSCH